MIPTIVVTTLIVVKSNIVVYSYLIDLNKLDKEIPIILIVKLKPLARLVIVLRIIY